LVSQGATDFYRRFGNRKLEDNWRISNKTVISFEDMSDMNAGVTQEEEDEYDENGNLIVKRETDPKKPAYYIQDLPLTPAAIDSSNMLIANAMYNAAIIYFDQLNDLKRSNEMLQKLIQRFPNHELELPCYFILWTNNTKLKNTAKAEEAKNVILTKYPNTDYAKLILDPNYYKKIADAAKENERKYEDLHRAYKSKQWETAVRLADDLLEQTDEVALIAKTSYLRAVALGQTQGREPLVEALTKIIKDYPKEPVTELAKILLSTLSNAPQMLQEGEEIAAIAQEPMKAVADSTFNLNLNEMHYVVVLVDVHKKTVTDVKYDVSTFNSVYFSLDRFNINSFYINQDEQLVTISRFKSKSNAMDYYIAITTNDVFAPSINDKSLTVYAISASNYSIYYNKPEARYLYKAFFEEHYQ
jgi:tetratricopeptide (TPR) repeat protein